MDPNLVYAKTPIGDEAVRQSTRVVQRNLRMVLVQVDGKMSVQELAAKIGNPRLVESALRELEEGGYIAPTIEAVSVWEESKKAALKDVKKPVVSAMSEFSTFGPKTLGSASTRAGQSAASNFSSFGKPILPTAKHISTLPSEPIAAEKSFQESDSQLDRPRTSWPRLLGLGAIVVLVALLGVVLLFPYERFKPAIEAASSEFIQAPVKIDSVGFSLLPTPVIKLSGIRIGDTSYETIAEIRLSSPFSLLGNAPYHLSRVDVLGASLSANRLVGMPMFVSGSVGSAALLVRKMNIDKLEIRIGEHLPLLATYGQMAFGADGALEKATFETEDRSLLVEATPGLQGIDLNIEGRAWQPAGAAMSFASMQAKGLLQKNRLQVLNIDTTFLGGILRGNWSLDWANGLNMAGDGNLIRLDARKVAAALAPSLRVDGDMNGSVRLRSSGSDWASLWGNIEAVLATEITRGAFHGVDLGEAARRSGVSDVRAGSTKFDRLRSSLTITPRQVVGRDVRMDAGMVTAAGQFVAGRDGLVDGNMAVTVQTSVSTQQVPVRVSGTLPDLVASTRK